jgi:hypothetical protein
MDFRLGQHSYRENDSQAEKRAAERYGLELPVTLFWKDETGETREAKGTTRNLSPSGTYIVCESQIAEGRSIDLRIDVPVALGGAIMSRISANGTIVRNGERSGSPAGYGHGVMFDHLSFKKL